MLRERNEHHENINSEIPVAEELDADTGNASISALPLAEAEARPTNDIIDNSGMPQNGSTPIVQVAESNSGITNLFNNLQLIEQEEYIRDRESEMSSYFLAERYNNFPKYFFTKATVGSLFLSSFFGLGLHYTFASAGSWLMSFMDKSYHMKEVATSALNGHAILCPLVIYLENLYFSTSNKSRAYKYLTYARRLVTFVLIPIIGYTILKQTSGVEMQIEQHIAAYLSGSATLFIPYSILSSLSLPYIYKDYFNIEQDIQTFRASMLQARTEALQQRLRVNELINGLQTVLAQSNYNPNNTPTTGINSETNTSNTSITRVNPSEAESSQSNIVFDN